MMRDKPTSAGKRILFWDDEENPSLASLIELGRMILGTPKFGQPRDYIRRDVPWEDRETLSRALQLRSGSNTTGGDVLMGYFGWANCRLCKQELGTRDFFGHGFVWPEKAEHYILDHHVWSPGCDEMLVAVRKALRDESTAQRQTNRMEDLSSHRTRAALSMTPRSRKQ